MTEPTARGVPSEGRRGPLAVRIAVNALFVAALVAVFYAIRTWGPIISVVKSQSMYPTYTIGDLIIVFPWQEPKIGQPAQFRAPIAANGQDYIMVAHRIIGKDADGYITKGDNPVATEDHWRIQPDDIVGTVVYALPRMTFFQGAAGLIGLCVTIALWPSDDDEGAGQEETEITPPAPA